MKTLKTLLTVLFLVILSTPSSHAHSGRTNSSGCHNCYTDYCYGDYHCHNGGYDYNPEPIIYSPPPPVFPDIKASFEFIPNENGTFNVKMDWNDVSNTGFSIALQKYQGADPGPLTDTHFSEYTFEKIYPGTYYANMRVSVRGTWSNIIYWKVDVPEWYPPSPTNTPEVLNADITNTEPNWLLTLWLMLVASAIPAVIVFKILHWIGSKLKPS